MPSRLSWIYDDLVHITKFWKSAVVLAVLVSVGTWSVADFLARTQISNLQSEVALLKSQLEARSGAAGPLPAYSLGGSNLLIFNNPKWATQDTSRNVELDWNRLIDMEAYAVLRMRTEGEPTSSWVQARIVNLTNGEVVGTTEQHKGGAVSVRMQLPRASGTKVYSMQIRGEGAGLEGNIELLRTKP